MSHLRCIRFAHHMNMPHAVNAINDEIDCYIKFDSLLYIHSSFNICNLLEQRRDRARFCY